MNIEIDIYESRDVRGRVGAVGAKARIGYSPSDGYDAVSLEKLECDLGAFVEDRLRDALKRKESPLLNHERFGNIGEALAAFERETGRNYSLRAEGTGADWADFAKWQYAPFGGGNA